MRVGVDISPLVQTRAGTARHVRGLVGALRGRADLELELLSFGGTGRVSSVVRDTWWYSRGIARGAAGSTSSTARPSAGLPALQPRPS